MRMDRGGMLQFDREAFDEIAVELLMRGDDVKASVVDHWEAIRRLNRLGYHDGQIALKLRRARCSIQRTRTFLNIPPAIPRNAGSRNKLPPVDEPTQHRDLRNARIKR